MDTFQRLRFVTRHYPHLQGLRLVPLAVPFLLSAAWRSGQLTGVPGTAGAGARYWFLGLLAIGLTISAAMSRYYRERFGSVEPRKHLDGFVKVSLFVGIFVLSSWTQDALDTPIALQSMVIGLGLGYVGVSGHPLRTHYLALAALCLIFATLGLFGVSIHARDVLLDDLIGIGLIVIGVGDHLLLRRTLQPVSHVESF